MINNKEGKKYTTKVVTPEQAETKTDDPIGAKEKDEKEPTATKATARPWVPVFHQFPLGGYGH